MRKKTLISVACGLAAISCVAGLNTLKASASTTYSELLNDNFETTTTLNTESWNELGADSGASVALRANPNPFLQYDLAPGKSVATKDPITVADDECLVIEFKMNSISVAGAEWLSFVYGAEDTDLNDEAQSYGWCFLGDSMLGWGTGFTNNKYNADATLAPMWTAWGRNNAYQVYIHPDGSVELYQDLCMLISYVRAEDATDAMKDRNGHIGFSVTNKAASINLQYLKIGKFPESSFTAKDPATQVPGLWYATPAESITWMVEDTNPTKNGLSDDFVSNDENVGAWRLGNNVLDVNEKAAEVVSKAQIPAPDARLDKVFEMTADWDVNGLGAAKAEFAFGNASAGIAKHDDKNYLTIWDGETVVAEQEVTLGSGAVSVIGYGDGTIKATFNGKTVSGKVSTYGGAFAYNVTEGATNISLDNIALQAAGAYEHKGGASQATDFSEVDNSKWYIGSTEAMAGMPTGGGVYVEDGKLVFMNAGDASMIATMESYTNYEFGFDLLYIEQEGQENDDGDITRAPSFFPGIVYGMPNYDTFFGNEDMVYFQKQTVDLFGAAKFADGTTRVWLTEAQDMYTQNAAGKVINFKFVAKDGTITVTITNKTDDVEMYTFQVFNQDTTGHVSLQTTGCGNFDIDNMYIINLDDVTDYTLTQKTIEAKTENVFEGKTIEGAIDLGDMTNKSATFTVAEAVEGFTMNADGTYTYVAPATAPTAPVVVNYSVAIDDFTLGFVNPVGDASKYTVNSTITINVTAIVVSSIEVTAPTKVAYKTGEEIDLNGLVVKAIYNDGTEVTLSDGYTVDSSAVNFAEAGEYNVTVSFEGASATFKVTVEKAGGCFGTAMLASMVSALGLGFAALLVKKGKEED